MRRHQRPTTIRWPGSSSARSPRRSEWSRRAGTPPRSVPRCRSSRLRSCPETSSKRQPRNRTSSSPRSRCRCRCRLRSADHLSGNRQDTSSCSRFRRRHRLRSSRQDPRRPSHSPQPRTTRRQPLPSCLHLIAEAVCVSRTLRSRYPIADRNVVELHVPPRFAAGVHRDAEVGEASVHVVSSG